MGTRALSEAEIAKLRKQNGLLWCKLAGFQGYPARFCTPHEEEQLRKRQAKSPKTPQCAIVFLGLAPQYAWVNESAMLPFQIEPDFLGPSSQGEYNYNAQRKIDFDENKFRRNKDYRCAVLEAAMIQVYRESNSRESHDDLFPDAATTALLKSDVMPRLKQPQDECCICSGTTISGTLLYCKSCAAQCIHMHCLGDSGTQSDFSPERDLFTWSCSVCGPSDSHTGTVTVLDNSAAAVLGIPAKIDKAEGKKRRKSGIDSLQDAKAAPSAGGGLVKSGSFSDTSDAGAASASALGVITGANDTKRPRGGAQLIGAANSSKAELLAISALDPAVLSFASAGASRTGYVPAGSKTVDPDSEMTSGDDYCFVCDEGGTLLLCDFPNCRRVYHQACIWRTFPSRMDEGVAELPPGPGQPATLDEPWFCPHHICNVCGVLETTRVNLVGLGPQAVPQQLRAGLHAAAMSSGRPGGAPPAQADLWKCATCPFSMCSPCASGTGRAQKHQQQQHQQHEQQAEQQMCLQCQQPSGRLALAKLLESTVSRLCSTKPALPFLRPLLPVPDDNGGSGAALAMTSTATASRAVSVSGSSMGPSEGFSANVHVLESEFLTQSQGQSQGLSPPPFSFSQSSLIATQNFEPNNSSAGAGGSCNSGLRSAAMSPAAIEAAGLLGLFDAARRGVFSSGRSLVDALVDMRTVLVSKLARLGSLGLRGAAAQQGDADAAQVAVEAMLAARAEGGAAADGSATGALAVIEAFDAIIAQAEALLLAVRSQISKAERRMETETETVGGGSGLGSSSGMGEWRSECCRELPQRENTGALLPRTVQQWGAYLLSLGQPPKRGRGRPPGSGAASNNSMLGALGSAPAAAPLRPRAGSLGGSRKRGRPSGSGADREGAAGPTDPLLDASICDMLSDADASQIMNSMRGSGSGLRERVTLMEHGAELGQGCGWAEDEEEIMLSRLRDLASRCHSLQAALRRQQQRQQQTVQAALEPVAYADLSLIAQLRAATSGLRWQLLQRDRTLRSFEAGRVALQELRDGLLAETDAVNSEADRIRKECETLLV